MISPWADFFVGMSVLAAIPFLSLWWHAKQQAKLEPMLERERIEAEQAALARKAEAVAECLLELGLPQLEEKTKRLEVARRLCIAIFAY